MGVNKIILIGNLGKDPEMKYGQQSGKAVCRFSLAVNEKRGGEDQTEWFNIVCFDRTAEVADQYLGKGSQVYIEGRFQSRKYQDRDGNERTTTEVLVSGLTMLGAKSTETNRRTCSNSPKQDQSRQDENDPFSGEFGPAPTEDDMPF
jgi:single stranded DNA-binding protein (ssb)